MSTKTETETETDFDRARKSWDFPAFAKDFPRDDELDALVVAFARGDYKSVKDRAPELAKKAEDDAVKRAARQLEAAIRPDPAARLLVVLAAGLLVFLSAWWIAHDGPGPERAPQPVPTIEYPK